MQNRMEQLQQLLAKEYNCMPEDFSGRADTGHVLIRAALREGRRVYSTEPYFFHMVTLGGHAVITGDSSLLEDVQTWSHGKTGYELFTYPELRKLDRILNRYGYEVDETYHMFLPMEPVTLPPEAELPELRWYFREEIRQFYGDERFPNAICPAYQPNRPDRMVVCAMDGDRIMGMAGCSEDAPHWQQIGIDVLPAYRGRGIGTLLVRLLRSRIEAQGDLPFYGTSVANYRSWNIAWSCGFRPAWIELNALSKMSDNRE